MPRRRTARLDLTSFKAVEPIDAVYTHSSRPGHAGNPLIEAILPPPADDAEATRRMALKPDFDLAEVQGLTPRQRLDRIDDLDDLHVPTTWHLRREQRLTAIL